jgi:hypothetical protein
MRTDSELSAELDAIKELRRSAGWELVKERLQEELERRRTALESPQDMQTTDTTRGYIAALRLAVMVPEILEMEFKR